MSRGPYPMAKMGLRPRRKPGQHESVEQTHILNLLRSVGGEVWVLGTRRTQLCWKCKAPTRDMSTRQTPGIADIFCILPAPPLAPRTPAPLWWPGLPVPVWVEAKRGDGLGRLSAPQEHFRDRCGVASLPHVAGTLMDVTAFLMRHGWLKPDNVPHYRRPEL